MEIKTANLSHLREKVEAWVKKNRILLILLALGAVLLCVSGLKSGKDEIAEKPEPVSAPEFSLADEEERIAQALSSIDGAGRVEAVLTLKTGMSQELAENSRGSSRRDENTSDADMDKTVVTVSSGSGKQNTVPLRYCYPEYLGALIICDGAGNPEVKLKITQAVSSLTGLGTDKITVVKMKNSGGK